MVIEQLTLSQYRNYDNIQFSFDHNLNVFYGNNGQGKTNFIEAIYFINNGRSFRTSNTTDIIRLGENNCYLSMSFITDHKYKIDYALNRNGDKKIRLNNEMIKANNNMLLKTILFIPDHLKIIKDAASLRRKYIDHLIAQIDPQYKHHLERYNAILYQRNNLIKKLKVGIVKTDTLDIWNKQLSKYGSLIILNRLNTVNRLLPYISKAYHFFSSGHENLNLLYSCSVPNINLKTPDNEEIHEYFNLEFSRIQTNEIKYGSSLVGPHRDDLIFKLNEQDMRFFGSQGQQRTAILALKIAEIEYYNQINIKPIILLDDVFSELDHQRQLLLIEVLEDKQCLITTANLDWVRNLSPRAKIWEVKSGQMFPYHQ